MGPWGRPKVSTQKYIFVAPFFFSESKSTGS